MTRMEPRVAVVTGAGRGIGAGIAARLAAEGRTVAVVDLDAEAAVARANELRAGGHRAAGYGLDVSDEPAVAEVVARIEADLGAPTILVNNAGITRDNLLFKMTLSDWDAVMDVHLKGPFLLSREVQRFMVKQKFGRIVNISSTSALGNRGQANYAAAKAGIQGFTKALAIELGPFGITCNAIGPGFVDTAMTRATADRIGVEFDQAVADAEKVTPVRRIGTPADIADGVAFFSSDHAGFVTGQVLYIAGGPTV